MQRKKLILVSLVLFGILSACQNEHDKAYNAIKKAETELLTDSLQLKDSVAISLYDQYKMFAEKFPDDKYASEFLFKAAELANAVGMHEEAIKIFSGIPDQYPKFNKAAECVYISGFISETELNDPIQAKMWYERFLKEYPTHPLRSNIEASIKNLGKSPEELIAEFEAKATKEAIK